MGTIEIAALGLTFLFSIFGAKKTTAKKITGIVNVVAAVNGLIKAVTDAIKPDKDGVIRIEAEELNRIKLKVSETNGVIETFGKN